MNLTEETLTVRFDRYVSEAFRDGIIGKDRYEFYNCLARRLKHFLQIKEIAGLKPSDFDNGLLMEYRQFAYDEFVYVNQYKDLYPAEGRYGPSRYPQKRRKDNSVVQDMKALKAFMSELENTDEIGKSPFRRLSREKKKTIMHVMYNDPFFLRAEEFKQVLCAALPPRLEKYRDRFILNCCLGCRIGDLSRLSMENVGVSPEGIPYIHYFPSKTRNSSATNKEVVTPLVRCAFDIISRTRFDFNAQSSKALMQMMNKHLPGILFRCGIDRKVSIWDEAQQRNVYKPLWALATSRLARKTHVDMMNKVQIDLYAAGLHKRGSQAVNRYTSMELEDRAKLMNVAFGQPWFRVDDRLKVTKEKLK